MVRFGSAIRVPAEDPGRAALRQCFAAQTLRACEQLHNVIKQGR